MDGDPFNRHFKYLHKTQPWIQLRSALIIHAASSIMEKKVLTEYYNNIAKYLNETLGADVIFLTIVISIVSAIVYFIIISYVITQMDKSYFIRRQITAENPIVVPHLRLLNSNLTKLIDIVKIIVGLCLLFFGIVMLVLPGQGLITMLIGLSLIPFPGKDKMQQIILSRKSVQTTLDPN
jgi:hypothetical protein